MKRFCLISGVVTACLLVVVWFAFGVTMVYAQTSIAGYNDALVAIDELVHHVDGNKSNNATGNLHLISRKDHIRFDYQKGYTYGFRDGMLAGGSKGEGGNENFRAIETMLAY